MLMKSSITSLALALMLFSIASAARIEAQEQITVEGQILNGTADGGSIEGITVTFHHESPEVHDHAEVSADAEGVFSFQDIEFDPTAAYGVSVRYQGALYGMDVNLSEGSPLPLTLEVFDSVSDQEILSGGSSSLLFAAATKTSQTISALEIITITNDTQYTYVPGTEQPMNLMRFGLPPGATGLSVDTRLVGADYVQIDIGFAVLASVPPGTHELLFTYDFPYEDAQYTFTKNYRYGAEHLRILSPNEVLEISSAQLGEADSITIGERPYHIIEVSDLPKETQVTVDLLNLPKASLADKITQSLQNLRWEFAAPIGMMLVITFLVSFVIIKRRNSRLSESEANNTEVASMDDDRQVLLDMIAELESEFTAGRISEGEYRRRRRVLEARLTYEVAD